MNSKSIGKNIRNLIAIASIAAFVPVMALAGEREKHNPYTVLGHQVRSHLVPETPGANGEDLGPLVFQEIVPCRFVSTLEADQYRAPWGGKEFQIMENRTYWPKGVLVASDGWVNPCSERVPVEAVAVAVRLISYAAPGEGGVFLAPSTHRTNSSVPTLWFQGGTDEMREGAVVLRENAFSVLTDQTTHLSIDVIGYFLRDPKGSGPKGEKGERGLQGERGEQGLQGERGLQGDRGERGEQGLQGPQGERGLQGERGEQGLKGDTGETGAQGLKGDKGDKGETGAQGLKGDTGETGAQGLKGDKGDKGDTGAQGLKGDKGDTGAQGLKGDKGDTGAQGLKGDKGDTGAQGLKGDKGETGAQGLKGDKGETGAQGSKGDKGDKGETGPQGAQGAQGPKGADGAQGAKGDKGAKGDTGLQGPAGPMGPQGPKGDDGGLKASIGGPHCFPPGGSLKINDPKVTANSFIVLTYIEVSNGNALGVASVSNGSFVATGSPNKKFKYIVLTPQ